MGADRTGDAPHEPDRMPTDDEEQAAEDAARRLHDAGEAGRVAEHYQEMARRGVEQEGEGRIE